ASRMLTRRGWLVAVGTAALGVGGRLLATELLTLAAGAGVLVAAALVAVRLPRPRLRATRVLHPAKVHAGSESRVELVIVNEGRSRTPVVAVRDPFDRGRRDARFLLGPVDPAQVARAGYRRPTEPGGVVERGPLRLGLDGDE